MDEKRLNQMNQASLRYQKTEKGKKALQKAQEKWRQSEKGKAFALKRKALRAARKAI